MRGAGLWNIWIQGVQILNKCAGAFRQISGIVCKDNIGCDIAVFNRSAYNSFFLNQRGGRLRDNTDPHAHFHKIKGRTGIVIDTEPVRTQVLVLKFFPQKVFPAAVYDKRELRKIIKRNGRRKVVGKKLFLPHCNH